VALRHHRRVYCGLVVQVNFERLQNLVENWAHERGIFKHSTATMQLLKAVSEMGELADAHAKDRKGDQIDAVGDVMVCLICYCYLRNVDPVECLMSAWEQIKDRKGRMMPGGVFVKDADD
jgi:NTP pyrophosphatase (non-canonical NTP hydrolase)